MICVPILADDPAIAKRDAIVSAERGADIVEFRVDLLMELEESLASRIAIIKNLVEDSPLPCIVTCRPEWEGGLYSGDEDERVSMFEAVGTADHPPAYIDVELKAYQASANIKQKINLAVDHPKQQRAVRTRLILSSHDFEGRPADLTRRLMAMHDEPACAVVKVAYRARSIRDNLELFDILSERQKPTIALCMGEFGTMSRVLAPKFGGFLTFATLRDASATASGQPTIEELLGMYRFRSIKPSTKVYGIIGWPVTQSMSPLVHNAGFEAIGWDGVYVPMPVAADETDTESSYTSFKTTFATLIVHADLGFEGASITIPHKQHAARLYRDEHVISKSPFEQRVLTSLFCIETDEFVELSRSCNTFVRSIDCGGDFHSFFLNTDKLGVIDPVGYETDVWGEKRVVLIGAGGAARAAAFGFAELGASVGIMNRSTEKAEALADVVNLPWTTTVSDGRTRRSASVVSADGLSHSPGDIYINCTPVGMAGGPDPDGLSIPIPDLPPLPPETVFFDTVYNPIETPMLREAKARGYRTIDGVQMFVKQAEAQFALWTGQQAPEGLFDRLVREKLTTREKPSV
ncbi:MAG: type I 3-dehydroquinate dehydratase [Phycisphaerales bacterium]